MVAIAQHGPAAPEHPVHRARDPRRDRLHAAAEGLPVRGLDQEVQVIALDRELDDPEVALVAGLAERRLEGAHEAAVSERAQALAQLQRDVAREASAEVAAAPVAHPRVRPRSSAHARDPAPSEERKLRRVRHTLT